MSGRKVDSESLRDATVSAKVEEGNITAAVRILCSEDAPADFSQKVFQELQKKHPIQTPGPHSHPAPDGFTPHQTTEAEVLKGIKSFPTGSAAGSDGLCPQHLLEMVLTRDAGPALLTATTAFVNLLLSGTCHKDYTRTSFLVVDLLP